MAKTSELVIIPAPGMGHLVSMLKLAKLLLQKNESISISIHVINLPIHSAKTTAYVNAESRDNPFPDRLTFLTLPPLSTQPDSNSLSFFVEVIELHKPLVKALIEQRLRTGFGKPVGFVLDMFCSTMVDIANDLSVPSYVFLTSGASFLNFIFYAGSLADEHGLQARDLALKLSDPEFSPLIPGFKNPLTNKSIPAIYQREFGSGLILKFANQFRKMKGILINTYMELEPFSIESLQDSNDKNKQAYYPVGPILELKSKDGSHENENKSIMEWLNNQPESSVVFLCFGSIGSFKEDQVKEIANGLAQSGYRFLWALRKPSSGKVPASDNEAFLEGLPEGFLDRMSDRGKIIIGWAPQVDVLAHPAVGGFVSHCGWNSTLESVWFGVPMGTWPMYAEQNLNAFELVKELDMAVEIRNDYAFIWTTGTCNCLVKAAEIEEGLKKLMNIDEKIKENVKKASEKGRKALEDGGSSSHWLGRFIEDVLNKVDY